MSYLHAPRLVFTGDFLSDVSTVNNDPAHYNNATFQPSFQEPASPDSPNGWWNPEGGAIFDFRNCSVKRLFLPDGSTVIDPTLDIAVGQIVMGAEGRPTGKMVDIDPDAQMYSALWCVKLRIATKQNQLLFQGDLEPTSFRDLQMRQTDGAHNNGQALGATWTSVLKNVEWGEVANLSPFLKSLRATTQENKLSVNLNSFGYYYAHNDGRFSMGRILGAIGPYFSNEPITFAPARRLFGILKPAGQKSMYFTACNFLTDYSSNRVTVDLGACFPVSNSLGAISINQPIYLAVSKIPLSFIPDDKNGTCYISAYDIMGIGSVDYEPGNNWLTNTGGIVSFNNVAPSIMMMLRDHQLILVTNSSRKNDEYLVIAREPVDGRVTRADEFVFRLDANETHGIKLHAYQWGLPLADDQISVQMLSPTPDIPLGPNNPISIIYGNNFPQNGISYQQTLFTDTDGTSELPMRGNPIHSPRHYIDGQMYTFDYQLKKQDKVFDPENIVVHLRDEYTPISNPVWDDIAPIMIQFGNLYPIMSKYIASFADPAAIIEKKDIFIFAFSRPIHDTMHMPVTRDLSEGKRQTILNWLRNPRLGSSELMIKEVSRDENPVPENTPLTAEQEKYRAAVKLKNGSFQQFPVIENMFENL